MGGAVPIRPVNQTVETPSPGLPSNPLRAEPIESNAGAALSGAGDALLGIWQKQQQAQNAINLNDRMGHFQQDFGQAKVNALNSGLSAQDMTQQLQDTSKSLIDAYTTAPANKAIAPQLALLMREHAGLEMGTFPIEATDRVRQDLDYRAKLQVANAAQSTAPLYTIDGDASSNPVFRDSTTSPNGGPIGTELDAHAHAMINGAYDPVARETENQVLTAQYDHQKAVQRGMLVAMDHPSLVDAYIKQNPTLTPEEQMTMTNRATAAINLPMRRLDAANAATRAQLMTQFKNQIADPAKYGSLDPAKVDQARQFRLIDDGDYQQITGYQYMSSGNPGAISAMQKQIANTTDENDLETLRGAINGPLNAELYGKGAIPLNAAIENQKRQLTTVEGQQRRQDNDQIKRAFQSLPGVTAVGIGPEFYNKLAAIKGLPTMNDLRTNTINDYNALTYGVSDPAKLRASRVKAIQDNQPDLEAVGLGKYVKPATPPPPIRPLSADDARRVIRLAHEKGYIP